MANFIAKRKGTKPAAKGSVRSRSSKIQNPKSKIQNPTRLHIIEIGPRNYGVFLGKYLLKGKFSTKTTAEVYLNSILARRKNPGGDQRDLNEFKLAVRKLSNKTATLADAQRAVTAGIRAGYKPHEVWSQVKRTWNTAQKKHPKRNPGVIETLATLATGASAALDVHRKIKNLSAKKRTPTKAKAKSGVRTRSQKKNPIGKIIGVKNGWTLVRYLGGKNKVAYSVVSPDKVEKARASGPADGRRKLERLASPKKVVRTAKKNPEIPASVQAYRTFHKSGLAAAKTFIDKSRELSAAEKRTLKRDLADYDKPPTIGARNNPEGLTARQMRTNGILSRWRARSKAASEFKKELRAEAKLDRIRKRKAKAVKKARNPGKAVSSQRSVVSKKTVLYLGCKIVKKAAGLYEIIDRTGHAFADTTKLAYAQTIIRNRYAKAKPAVRNPAQSKGVKGTTTARKRNPSGGFEAFQGREATKTLDLKGPANIPANTWTLGELHEIRIPGKKPIDFTSLTGEKFYVLSDRGNKNLWIAGTRTGKAFTPDVRINPGEAKPVGRASHIVYKTLKAHLGDNEEVLYIHKFGEEGGERPHFANDRDGFAHIIGGDFTITPLGIRD